MVHIMDDLVTSSSGRRGFVSAQQDTPAAPTPSDIGYCDVNDCTVPIPSIVQTALFIDIRGPPDLMDDDPEGYLALLRRSFERVYECGGGYRNVTSFTVVGRDDSPSLMDHGSEDPIYWFVLQVEASSNICQEDFFQLYVDNDEQDGETVPIGNSGNTGEGMGKIRRLKGQITEGGMDSNDGGTIMTKFLRSIYVPLQLQTPPTEEDCQCSLLSRRDVLQEYTNLLKETEVGIEVVSMTESTLADRDCDDDSTIRIPWSATQTLVVQLETDSSSMTDLGSMDLDDFARTFQQTYNELIAFHTCDVYRRMVQSVTVTIDGLPGGAPTNGDDLQQFQLTVSTEGTCVGCDPTDLPLFDESDLSGLVSSTFSGSSSTSLDTIRRQLPVSVGNGICLCPEPVATFRGLGCNDFLDGLQSVAQSNTSYSTFLNRETTTCRTACPEKTAFNLLVEIQVLALA